jgi:hypothetical protein
MSGAVQQLGPGTPKVEARAREPVGHHDPEGERALEAEVDEFRRRRLLVRVGVLVLLAAIAVLWLWPAPACDELADEACAGGIMHCARLRAALERAFDEAECAAFVERLRSDEAQHALVELQRRFPEALYTPEETEVRSRRGLP